MTFYVKLKKKCYLKSSDFKMQFAIALNENGNYIIVKVSIKGCAGCVKMRQGFRLGLVGFVGVWLSLVFSRTLKVQLQLHKMKMATSTGFYRSRK